MMTSEKINRRILELEEMLLGAQRRLGELSAALTDAREAKVHVMADHASERQARQMLELEVDGADAVLEEILAKLQRTRRARNLEAQVQARLDGHRKRRAG